MTTKNDFFGSPFRRIFMVLSSLRVNQHWAHHRNAKSDDLSRTGKDITRLAFGEAGLRHAVMIENEM